MWDTVDGISGEVIAICGMIVVVVDILLVVVLVCCRGWEESEVKVERRNDFPRGSARRLFRQFGPVTARLLTTEVTMCMALGVALPLYGHSTEIQYNASFSL